MKKILCLVIVGLLLLTNNTTAASWLHPAINTQKSLRTKNKQINESANAIATFLGGAQDEYTNTALLDEQGNIYVALYTHSANLFLPTNAYQNYTGNGDIYLAKFNPDLTQILAATFLGGAQDDCPYQMVRATNGDIYLTGYTESTDFPVTPNAFDNVGNGHHRKIFIACLNSELTHLRAATYLAGEAGQEGRALALDSQNNVFIAGHTYGILPIAGDAYDTTYNNYGDMFVAKFNTDLSQLTTLTYLGGTAWEEATVLKIDDINNILIGGVTRSRDFPVTAGAFDPTFNGYLDNVTITKLDNNLTHLLASTYLGGVDGRQNLTDLQTDATGKIVLTGYTDAALFPTTAGSYQPVSKGGDSFISIFNNDLSVLHAATFLGGTGVDLSTALFINDGKIYLTGYTNSTDFPVSVNAFDLTPNGAYDAFAAILNLDLTHLRYATFIGGQNMEGDIWEQETGPTADATILVNTSGTHAIYIVGLTMSSDFPTTTGVFDENFNGGDDIFIIKLNNDNFLHSGDVDNNGLITAGDAQLAYLYALEQIILDERSKYAADCDGNGVVNLIDSNAIFRTALGTQHCLDILL